MPNETLTNSSTEIKQTMNEIDTQADRVYQLALRSDEPTKTILRRYARRLMDLSAETYRALRKVGPVVFPLEHPPLRSLTEADEERRDKVLKFIRDLATKCVVG